LQLRIASGFAPSELARRSRCATSKTEVSPSNFIFSAKDEISRNPVPPAEKMKFERLTFARERGDPEPVADAIPLSYFVTDPTAANSHNQIV
jgi:hypothetical protein